ncbi:MAG: acylphosphatase [Chlorobi bacterium]|nr:acylphosphatase [Chlorobiota bacterium]
MKCVILRVYGRVQGVGFRYFAVREASKYDIKGFVRNDPDGSVYIEAEGTPGNLDLFVQRMQSGPAWGRVEKVTVANQPVAGYSDFSVRY